MTGFIFTLKGAPISWSSHRQSIVAMSSTESEYIALASAATESVWLSRFLDELGYHVTPVPMKIDNQGAIQLTKNPQFHKKSKHIEKRFHKSRELVKNGEITPEYVPSAENIADPLTKPLLRERFTTLRNKMGVRRVPISPIKPLMALMLMCLV